MKILKTTMNSYTFMIDHENTENENELIYLGGVTTIKTKESPLQNNFHNRSIAD